jgi:guanine deaminase
MAVSQTIEKPIPTAAIRGPVLTFTGNPFKEGLEHTMVYESDAIVAFGGGKITHFGPAADIQ